MVAYVQIEVRASAAQLPLDPALVPVDRTVSSEERLPHVVVRSDHVEPEPSEVERRFDPMSRQRW
jgi:uncharacterized RmlC-like cupin family protein